MSRRNIDLYDTYVGRDVDLIKNSVLPWIVVILCEIKGSVNVLDNHSAIDTLIYANEISRNLHCAGNTPPADVTSPNYPDNRVGGKIKCEDRIQSLISKRRLD